MCNVCATGWFELSNFLKLRCWRPITIIIIILCLYNFSRFLRNLLKIYRDALKYLQYFWLAQVDFFLQLNRSICMKFEIYNYMYIYIYIYIYIYVYIFFLINVLTTSYMKKYVLAFY